MVAYLATSGCPLRGLVLLAHGRTVRVLAPWTPLDVIASDDVWTFDGLKASLDPLAALRFTTLGDLFPG